MRLLFLLGCSMAFACTDFVVQTQDQTFINGRSLEFALDLQSSCRIYPRGQQMASQNPNQETGVTWVSQYGFLGVTAFGQDFAMDGINEEGLSFGLLWLPGYTQYPTVAPEEMDKALDFTDLGAWILGNFATIEEVRGALQEVRVWGHMVPPLPDIPPVHVAVHDAQGNHLVIEFLEGEVKVHDNPTGVLTNSPPFDWQLINLSNYLSLSAVNASPLVIGGKTVSPPGEGSGLWGIPGDWTPPSRFVRINTCLRFAEQAASAKEGVNLAEHLLNAVDIPRGLVQNRAKKGTDYTQWVVIKDLTNKVFYFRSYRDLCLKKINLNSLNLSNPSTKTIPLNGQRGYIDVTSLLIE